MKAITIKALLCAALVSAAALLPLPAAAAQAVAFITNLKGDVAVEGAPRAAILGELAAGQKLRVGRDGQLSVMYIQSGREFTLGGPGDYAVGEREIASAGGTQVAARETAWRTSSQVLVNVAQTSSASIRMRSFTPGKQDGKPKLDFPTQGAVATLLPTLRWTAREAAAEAEVAIAVAGKEDKPLAKAKVAGGSHRLPTRLQPDTEYAWTVTVAGQTLGPARFRTLPAAALQTVEKRRPSERAEFSDRLMFALLLQELGAVQEAQQAWGKLAQERADLPELANLAR
jgi:hypothetical protein